MMKRKENRSARATTMMILVGKGRSNTDNVFVRVLFPIFTRIRSLH